jgi:putative multiple sugar transport system substrate-binding protein
MVDAALSGKDVPINDTKTYNNGVKVVPSNLLVPVAADKSNVKDMMIKSGYYKAEQLN